GQDAAVWRERHSADWSARAGYLATPAACRDFQQRGTNRERSAVRREGEALPSEPAHLYPIHRGAALLSGRHVPNTDDIRHESQSLHSIAALRPGKWPCGEECVAIGRKSQRLDALLSTSHFEERLSTGKLVQADDARVCINARAPPATGDQPTVWRDGNAAVAAWELVHFFPGVPVPHDDAGLIGRCILRYDDQLIVRREYDPREMGGVVIPSGRHVQAAHCLSRL